MRKISNKKRSKFNVVKENLCHLKGEALSNDVSTVRENDLFKFSEKENRYFNDDLPKYLLYDVDMYFDNEWKVVRNHDVVTCDLDVGKLIESKVFHSAYSALDFEWQMNWRQFLYISKKFTLDIQRVDKNLFESNLNQFLHTKFYYASYEIDDERIEWEVQNNKIYKLYSFTLQLSVVFFIESKNHEKLSLYVELPDNNENIEISTSSALETIKKKHKNINLYQQDNFIYLWNEKLSYKKGDYVVFDEKIYYCKTNTDNDHFVDKSPNNGSLWQLDKRDCYSFCDSFFNSLEGKRSLAYFKDGLSFFIDKNLGNKITLIYYNIDEPRLNSSFFYKNIKYRVVEVVTEYQANMKVVLVKGVQMFNLSGISLETIEECFNVENDDRNNILCNVELKDNYLVFFSTSKVNQFKECNLRGEVHE